MRHSVLAAVFTFATLVAFRPAVAEPGDAPTQAVVGAPSATEPRVCVPSTKATEPKVFCPQKAQACKSEGRVYIVKCRVTSEDGTKEKTVLSRPAIMVAEGEKASCSIHSSSPFVTGLKSTGEHKTQPVITVLDNGINLEVEVTSLRENEVQLDAKVETTSVGKVEMVPSAVNKEGEQPATFQAPEQCFHARRKVRAVKLGESVIIKCDCECSSCNVPKNTVVRLTVEEKRTDLAAITPLPVDSKKAKSQAYYSVIYSVGDLLEPYTLQDNRIAVEPADFLPVIDSLLTEAGCDWPSEAGIHPVANSMSVVISQTQEGHEKIADYLQKKRDVFAEVVDKILRK